jgi:hypothetical protein
MPKIGPTDPSRANHGDKLKAMKDREEALALVRAITEMAVEQIFSHVGMSPFEFQHRFTTANGTETRTAA